ncbi:hypothetical protein U9M48_006014 [Paspalum notatum var. saurae]|uniref:Uncharacterized protein n=1 Tax=Paspalum notatum var. saurae TaxID=547442 RepID=A0AAQ3PYR6_PASNO
MASKLGDDESWREGYVKEATAGFRSRWRRRRASSLGLLAGGAVLRSHGGANLPCRGRAPRPLQGQPPAPWPQRGRPP